GGVGIARRGRRVEAALAGMSRCANTGDGGEEQPPRTHPSRTSNVRERHPLILASIQRNVIGGVRTGDPGALPRLWSTSRGTDMDLPHCPDGAPQNADAEQLHG